MTKPRVEIWFELETRCNLHCKFCYNFWKDGSARPPLRLSTSKTTEALRRLFEVVDCYKIAISGGEPLLREDLYEILSFIHSYSVPMVLTTNSVLLNPQKIFELVDLGIATFEIPFHSTNQAMHDYLSGVECWETTLRNMIRLRASRCHVIPVFVATRVNLVEFLNVMTVCSLLGLNEIIFNRFVPTGLGSLHKDVIGVPDDKVLIEILMQANELARELGTWIHLGMPIKIPAGAQPTLNRVSLSSCPVAHGQLRWTVDAGANIRRCNQSGTSIGNLLEGGIDILVRELQETLPAESSSNQVQPCQILSNNKLVQLSVT